MTTEMNTGAAFQPHTATALLATVAAESLAAKDIECASLLLDREGCVCDANRSAEFLFGYTRAELMKGHVSLLLPKLAEVQDQDTLRRLAYLSHCGVTFRANRHHGRGFACAVFFTCLQDGGARTIRLTIRKIDDTGIPCL